MFESLLFWKYYFSAEGPARDLQLEKIYKHLIPSHLLLAVIALSPTMFSHSDLALFFTFIMFIFIFIQFSFQFRVCLDAVKRVHEIDSVKEVFKEIFEMAGLVTAGLAIGIVGEFEKIIKDLYEGYEEKYYEDQQKQYHQKTEHQPPKNETNEMKRIFDKYELAYDADIDTIKKRFRGLAKKYHPDMPNGDEKLFIELRDDMYFIMDYVKKVS